MGNETLKKLKREIVKLMFSPAVYKKGLEYFSEGRVSGLTYDANHNVWTAKVLGSEAYFVEVQIEDEQRHEVKTYCDCPAYATYDACKHIVATLLAVDEHVAERKATASKKEDYERSNQLIQSLTGLRESQVEAVDFLKREPMHVEYILKWTHDYNLFLELKTGVTRRYVVRDLAHFLHSALSEMEHEFTKHFIYHPEQHYFLQKDIHLFQKLANIIRNEQVYEQSNFEYYHDNIEQGRSLVIPPLAVEDLLEDLVERDLIVTDGINEYKKVSLIKDVLPFQFSVSPSEEAVLRLTLSNQEEVHYFPNYHLLLSEGNFYTLNQKQMQVMDEILLVVQDQTAIPVSKEQADLFLSAVVPSLEEIGEVNVADEVTQKLIDVPLRAKFYLEMRADTIYGTLTYTYGSIEIDPFGEAEEKDKFVLRDLEKEQKIMQWVEHSNFHYNGKELYVVPDEEGLYEFFATTIPQMEKEVELYLTSELRSYVTDLEIEPTTNVAFNETTQLLDIGFDIEGLNQEDVENILSAVVEKKRYYRLSSGSFISLENKGFENVGRLLNELDIDDPATTDMSVPLYRGAAVDELLQTKKQYDASFQRLLTHLQHPEKVETKLPEGLEADLRSYQKIGYRWFKSLSTYHLGGILADDMGLGKTLQTIAYLLSEKGHLPHLVVVPSSVVYNWKRECEKFAPTLSVDVLAGTPEERAVKIEKINEKDVWITSYTTLRQDIELYQGKSFQALILDEAQYIKNYRTKTSQAIRQIRATRTFALSGTPIENSIEELWAIFQVILPGLLPNERKFKQLSHDQIARMTRPFILRRLKEDVLTELPEKIESVYTSPLTKEQKELYVAYWQNVQREAQDSMQSGDFRKNRMKILAGITRLRQICCHPSLFMENYTGSSGKLDELLTMLETLLASGKRILLFSQFTSMHDIFQEVLSKQGIPYFYLHGGTNKEKRVEMCERFNQGEKNVFLISLKAGGTGLNLTGADTVILYDLWWNPAVEDQAAGRAHRFGQKNVVQVIRLVSEGTIEERIYDLQQKKRELIDAVIKPGEEVLSSLNEEDIRMLLSIE